MGGEGGGGWGGATLSLKKNLQVSWRPPCSTLALREGVIAGHEHYLKKVRIRFFVPNCNLDFDSHLWDATVLIVARQSSLVDVNRTRSTSLK